mmetsp:Transcript_9314/g.19792  ORF Transcript_9314/g.19792 Transcript_9314/m.19792 type:complete len:162 (-) Transcript_9314:1672-2157(-)
MLSFHKVLPTVFCILLLVCSGANVNATGDSAKRVKRAVPKGLTSPRGALANREQLRSKTVEKIEASKRLNRREKKEVAQAELETYKALRYDGVDEVTNTAEAVMLRNYRLRAKKRRGMFHKKTIHPGTSFVPWGFSRGIYCWRTTLDLCRLGGIEEDSSAL